MVDRNAQGRNTLWSNRSTRRPRIAPQHLEMLARSGISTEVAKLRGYRTAYEDEYELLRWLKFSGQATNSGSGLLIPQLRFDGSKWGVLYRPDAPYLNGKGKPVKYVAPVGQRNGLDVPPGVGESLGDPDVWLWVVEGTKKADAGASHGFCIVSISGVWNWITKGKIAVGDWYSINLENRTVVVGFDSDMRYKPGIRHAATQLASFLESRGARVKFLHLPDGDWWDDDSKTGLDDFLAAGNTYDDAMCLVKDEPPELITDNIGDPTQPSEADIVEAIKRFKTVDEAKRRRQLAVWEEPQDQGDAIYQELHKPPRPKYVVAELIPAAARVLVNGQWKGGKTTLALNLVKSLLTGESFLRIFEVTSPVESVGYWNHEVDMATFGDWLADMKLNNPNHDIGHRLHPYSWRDEKVKPDLRDPQWVEWTTRWLQERRIKTWVIDTFTKIFRGLSIDNDEVNRWWLILEDMAASAGVETIVLLHHTGNAEDTQERARGASSLMALPDVLWTFRHNGKPNTIPPDNIRWLKAFGRNANVEEFEIDYDTSTRELYSTNSGQTRRDSEKQKRAEQIWAYLDGLGIPQKQGDLLKAVGLPVNGKGRLAISCPALEFGRSKGWLSVQEKGTSKLWSPGKNRPQHAASKIKLKTDGNAP
jgi:hypothetical protein